MPWLVVFAIAFPVQSKTMAGAVEDEGQAAYLANCASCHGETLSGGFGPPLSTEAFRKKWAGSPKSFLQMYIASRMPPAAPKSLDAATYAAVTDFVDMRSGLVNARTSGVESKDVPSAPEQGAAISPVTANCDETCRATLNRLASLIKATRPVSEARLREPNRNDWLGWSGGRSSQNYSALTQINRSNVRSLSLAWSLALSPGTNAIAPLVNDGVMFVNHSGTVQALDARNGDVIWSYTRAATNKRMPISQPRGFALHEGAVYVPTLDNHVLALDAKTGTLLWDRTIAPSESGLVITAAPLVARGKVFQGMSGCFGKQYPGGCFIVALDTKTGREVWRFNTIARPGLPGGDSWNGAPVEERFGASVWSAGSYDPQLNLVYFGTAQTYYVKDLLKVNPSGKRSANALYTNTTLALDPDTGRLVWHYQHLPGDVWNLDWAFERTIVEMHAPDGVRKAILTAGKLGIVEALDASTGKYLWSFDLGLQNLIKTIDPDGRKHINPDALLVPGQPKLICPSPYGARAWPTLAYDPQTEHLYLPLAESCIHMSYDAATGELAYPLNALVPPPDHDGKFGQVVALDVRNQTVTWRSRRRMLPASAALATAGGLLFEGSRDHRFRALDSATGATLWEVKLNETPSSFPLSFMVEGRQYIAVVTGGGNPWDVNMRSFTPELPAAQVGTTLWVFHLAENRM
ncbi:PQQ-binding-like beta-propeller repeat protein [Steroidobacter sp. S1-65]|uniref:PQQ-binding-like beta-propeller repeat protein n=2 Tax=Steroidobacter gossypii TaxID=2805490 RepID=A0ABS1X6R4_9GAMM|nr:PQQ-binding-like beta-propeller repeat protein [Steroidobacter gossypii]